MKYLNKEASGYSLRASSTNKRLEKAYSSYVSFLIYKIPA